MKARKPSLNAAIGVFSASSPISATVPVRYQRGKQYLEGKGFRVVDGSLCGRSDFYRSGSISERADEFNALLHDESISILMSSIGGNNTNSILPYIDYEYLKEHPKIIVGYSDSTALLLAVYAKTGLVTFYGPALAASFGEFPPYVDQTFDSFRQIACGQAQFPHAYAMPALWTDEFISWSEQDRAKSGVANEWLFIRPSVCEGRLIGGNLNTM